MTKNLEGVREVIGGPLAEALAEALSLSEDGRKPEEVVVHLTYDEAVLLKEMLAQKA
jgi:hypothetical protein